MIRKRRQRTAARCSPPSICLASAGLKKCLHLTLSPYRLSSLCGGGEEEVGEEDHETEAL